MRNMIVLMPDRGVFVCCSELLSQLAESNEFRVWDVCSPYPSIHFFKDGHERRMKFCSFCGSSAGANPKKEGKDK